MSSGRSAVTRRRAGAAVAAAALWLAGCGGGGGTAEGEEPGSGGGGGGGGTALAFRSDNVGYAAGFALYAGDLAARSAQLAIDALRDRAGIEPRSCAAGTVQRDWTDADRNGRMSAGDVLAMRFSECMVYSPNIVLDGAVEIRVRSVGDAGLDHLTAEVRIGSGGLYIGSNLPSREPMVGGSFVVGWAREEKEAVLTVSASAADDFRREFQYGGAPTRDVMRGLQLVKRVRHDLARSVVTLAMRYESGELGGSFEVSTPVPIYGGLSVYPGPASDQGRMVLRGADGDLATLSLRDDPVYPLALDFDDGGDGSIDAVGRGRWVDLGNGYLWQDVTAWTTNTLPYEQGVFQLSNPYRGGATVPVTGTLRLQFTRPLDATRPLKIRLVDYGRIYDIQPPPLLDHPVQVERHGALVLVRLLEPLRYSRNYSLLLETGDSDGQSRVYDEQGRELVLVGGPFIGSLRSPDELRPIIQLASAQSMVEAQRSVVLSGEASVTDPATLLRAQWSQVDGPSVVFDGPSSLRTGVRLQAGVASLPTRVRVRLTLHHTSGAQESTDMELKAAAGPLPAQGPSFRFCGPAAGGAGEFCEAGGSATGDFVVGPGYPEGAVFFSYGEFPGATSRGFYLSIAPPTGSQVAAGDVVDAPLLINSPVFPSGGWQLGLQQLGLDCTPAGNARLVVHEIERGTSGEVTRLAADVQATCTGSSVPLRASVRLESAWPLPP